MYAIIQNTEIVIYPLTSYTSAVLCV